VEERRQSQQKKQKKEEIDASREDEPFAASIDFCSSRLSFPRPIGGEADVKDVRFGQLREDETP